jgi:hypothetical protein
LEPNESICWRDAKFVEGINELFNMDNFAGIRNYLASNEFAARPSVRSVSAFIFPEIMEMPDSP